MATTGCENRGFLFELDQWPKGSPEEEMERLVQEIFARARGRDGKVPSRRWYEVAEGARRPVRVLLRRMVEARQAGVPREELEQLVVGMLRYLDRKYGTPPRPVS